MFNFVKIGFGRFAGVEGEVVVDRGTTLVVKRRQPVVKSYPIAGRPGETTQVVCYTLTVDIANVAERWVPRDLNDDPYALENRAAW